MSTLEVRFQASFDSLAAIGRDAVSGGYNRLTWSQSDLQARAWFVDQADRLGLSVEVDKNANMWAWWGSGRQGAVATSSHLDTVVNGGAFDGAPRVGFFFCCGEAPPRDLQDAKEAGRDSRVCRRGGRHLVVSGEHTRLGDVGQELASGISELTG